MASWGAVAQQVLTDAGNQTDVAAAAAGASLGGASRAQGNCGSTGAAALAAEMQKVPQRTNQAPEVAHVLVAAAVPVVMAAVAAPAAGQCSLQGVAGGAGQPQSID